MSSDSGFKAIQKKMGMRTQMRISGLWGSDSRF